MAKIKRSETTLSGKIGNRVHVVNRKTGDYTREDTNREKSKSVKEVLAKQNKKPASLNSLASELSSIIRLYCGAFKEPRMYNRLLKQFWKAGDNRFIQLQKLRGLDINQRYPYNKMGSCTTTVEKVKNKIVVKLKAGMHPPPGQYKFDAYYYEVILLSWEKGDKKANHSSQHSSFIQSRDKKMPSFTFPFTRPAGTIHWLLCLRQVLSLQEKDVESFKGESLQITDAGTFDKKDLELLAKHLAEKKAAEETGGRKAPMNIVRVQPDKE